MTQPTTQPERLPGEVVLEVPREGRRPRYHRGYRAAGSTAPLRPEQCNLDQTRADVRTLEELPPIKLARTQLCRRCFRGHPLLEAEA